MSYNVLRWSVLATGVAYGFMHDRTLQSKAVEAKKQKAYDNRVHLIAEAKAEYAKLHAKPPTAGAPTTDPASPDFDPVKLIDWAVQSLPAA